MSSRGRYSTGVYVLGDVWGVIEFFYDEQWQCFSHICGIKLGKLVGCSVVANRGHKSDIVGGLRIWNKDCRRFFMINDGDRGPGDLLRSLYASFLYSCRKFNKVRDEADGTLHGRSSDGRSDQSNPRHQGGLSTIVAREFVGCDIQ